MLDIASINRSLGSLDGMVYHPASESEPGILYAGDSLSCFVSQHGDYLTLRAPIVFPDEMESEDFRSETGGDSEFYTEQIAHLSYFLRANAYGGSARGACVCFDPELEAVTLVCKARCRALDGNGLQQLIHSLFRIVLKQRLDLFPDDVDPGMALLADDRPGSLPQAAALLDLRV